MEFQQLIIYLQLDNYVQYNNISSDDRLKFVFDAYVQRLIIFKRAHDVCL